MPTIEIVSIEAEKMNLAQTDFQIAIEEEHKLISHRGLFYDFLLKQKGTIVHLGDPSMIDDEFGVTFAGGIVDWDFEPTFIEIPVYEENEEDDNRGANQQFRFKFLSEYVMDVDKLLRHAVDCSKIKRAMFLSDYQFGPENGSYEKIFTITDFWSLHNEQGLAFNTLYEMYGY